MKPIHLHTEFCSTTLIEHALSLIESRGQFTYTVQIIKGLDNRDSDNQDPTILQKKLLTHKFKE